LNEDLIPYGKLSPETLAAIAKDFVVAGDIQSVTLKYNISSHTLSRLRREGRLDTMRSAFASALRKKTIQGELRAREDVAYDEAYQGSIGTIKNTLKELFFDLYQLWREKLTEPEFQPRSPEGLANAMQKVADTFARVNEEGDLRPTAISITVTGQDPALLAPRDAVDVELIGSEPAQQCLQSDSLNSTGSLPQSTTQAPGIELSSEDVV
jgi:hypothetical protein